MNTRDCTEKMTTQPIRVGGCEFRLSARDECRLSLSEGLLHLGAWTSDRISVQERTP